MTKAPWMLGLSLGALALGGCARNLCENEPSDPRCLVATMPPADQSALTVAPTRLSLTAGGQLAVEIKPAPPAGSTVVLRRPNAKDLPLGSATSGKLTASLRSADLSANNFTPGAAQVVLQQPGQPELATTLRLVVEPQFTQPVKVYDATPNSDYPIWIAVNQTNTVYTLNKYPSMPGMPDRLLRVGEYQLANNALTMRVPQTFGSYKAYPFKTVAPAQAVLSGANIVVISKDPVSTDDTPLGDRCGFSTGQCQSVNLTTQGFKVIAGLASDRQGGLFAVQTDIGTLAYRGSDMNPFAEKLVIDNANKPAAGTVTFLASGDVDGDAQSDLVVFHAMPAGVSVFLRQTDGKQLRYSDSRSVAMQSALGTLVPSAVAVADMDSDGLADLLVVNNGAVSLFFNLGSGWAPAAMPIPILPGADSLAVGTIDPGVGTGAKTGTQMDIAVASSTSQRIAVLINQASF